MKQQFESRDLDAEQLLLERLGQQGLLAEGEMAMRVRGKVAYIEGAVPNLTQKREVEQSAAQVEGVHTVVNMLRITPMAVVDDESLGKHLLRALARNSRVDDAKMSVEVTDGIVYLRGFSRTPAERYIAEDECWATSGVRSVRNEIKVPSETPRTDIEIVGEILQGFSQCLGMDLSNIDVVYQEGVLHLRGAVPNERLRSAAEDLACWTPSVTEVVNDLKVVPRADSTGSLSVAEEGSVTRAASKNRQRLATKVLSARTL